MLIISIHFFLDNFKLHADQNDDSCWSVSSDLRENELYDEK